MGNTRNNQARTTEFARTEFGGEWYDATTGETTCELMVDASGNGTFSVDVWRADTGTVTYRDIVVLPAHGIPEFGLENDLAVQVDMSGYALPVAVQFGTAHRRGIRDEDDGDEMFFRTFVEALENGYDSVILKAAA